MIKLESRKIFLHDLYYLHVLSKLTTSPIHLEFFRGAQPSASKVRGAETPAAHVVPTPMEGILLYVHCITFHGQTK